MRNKKTQNGQGLLEVLVALGLAMIVLTALSVAAVTSVRNAVFAKNSSQANAYARQAMDYIRAYRDIKPTNFFYDPAGPSGKVAGCYQIGNQANPNPDPSQATSITQISGTQPCSTINDGAPIYNTDGSQSQFTRSIYISPNDSTCPTGSAYPANSCSAVTVTVFWQDSTGTHQSQVKSIFGKWQ